MDKFGWQKPMIEPGMTGIEKACMIRKAEYRMKKASMIAEGMMMAEMMERRMR